MQSEFDKIPGSSIGYWASPNIISNFSNPSLGVVAHPRRTIQCGDVIKYIRFWYEPNYRDIEQSADSKFIKEESDCKWFYFSSGGSKRKWYGNLDEVLYWYKNGTIIKETGLAIIPNEDQYLKKCIGYNRITSNGLSFRYYNNNILLGDATSMVVLGEEQIPYLLGLLNTKIPYVFMQMINPTLAAQTGSLSNVPIKEEDSEEINTTVLRNIYLSKLDWDAHETSWDFAENPLVAIMKQAEGEEPVVPKKETGSFKPRNQQFLSEKPAVSKRETDSFAAENSCEQGEAEDDQAMVTPLPDRGNDVTKPWYDDYRAAVTALEGMAHPTDGVTTHGSTLEMAVNAFEKLWTARFMQLHANEEELNRQFIDIYGLQDELTPDVPLNEITILQQGEICIE